VNVVWRAGDLLGPGETGIVLFTEGRNLILHRDGTGSSGNWVIDSTRQVGRVIVFQEVEHRQGLTADVFSGEFVGFEGPNLDGRFVVRMRGVSVAGLSPCGWQEFVGPGQNPVRYLERPAEA
jgi:hypothetical protein